VTDFEKVCVWHRVSSVVLKRGVCDLQNSARIVWNDKGVLY
jgi:hypothetical protein